MQILQVCHRYHPHVGGVETHVREISERLVKEGHEVIVATTDPTGKLPVEEMVNGVHVVRKRSIAPNEAFYVVPGMKSYIAKTHCDIIHAHNYHALPALSAALAKKDRAFVFTPHYHGSGQTLVRNILHIPYRHIGRRTFEKADRIVCVSEFEANMISKRYGGRFDSKTTIIPNGLNLDLLRSGSVVEKSAGSLLYVGRLEKYKGVQKILEALKFLPEHRLTVIGNGPYKEKLLKHAENLRVDGRVEWLQNLSGESLAEHYRSASLMINLSSFEAYGITVAEALAAGTKCIVATGTALEDFVDCDACIGISRSISAENLAELIRRHESRTQSTYSGRLLGWDDVTEQIINRVYLPLLEFH